MLQLNATIYSNTICVVLLILAVTELYMQRRIFKTFHTKANPMIVVIIMCIYVRVYV